MHPSSKCFIPSSCCAGIWRSELRLWNPVWLSLPSNEDDVSKMFRHRKKAIRIPESNCILNSLGVILYIAKVFFGIWAPYHLLCWLSLLLTVPVMLWQVYTPRHHQETGYMKQLLVAEHSNTCKEHKVVSLLSCSFPSFGIKSEKPRNTSFKEVRKEITALFQGAFVGSSPGYLPPCHRHQQAIWLK